MARAEHGDLIRILLHISERWVTRASNAGSCWTGTAFTTFTHLAQLPG